MSYLGIDPGVSGGLALVSNGAAEAVKMPATEADCLQWLEERRAKVTHALIEKVHSRPGQGVSSTFKFGKNYGLLRGLLVALRIPFEEVAPGKWQRALGCLSGGDKNVTKAKAQQLFPALRVTHATADALLIAEHCRRTRGGGL